jgi:hypothetical protein
MKATFIEESISPRKREVMSDYYRGVAGHMRARGIKAPRILILAGPKPQEEIGIILAYMPLAIIFAVDKNLEYASRVGTLATSFGMKLVDVVPYLAKEIDCATLDFCGGVMSCLPDLLALKAKLSGTAIVSVWNFCSRNGDIPESGVAFYSHLYDRVMGKIPGLKDLAEISQNAVIARAMLLHSILGSDSSVQKVYRYDGAKGRRGFSAMQVTVLARNGTLRPFPPSWGDTVYQEFKNAPRLGPSPNFSKGLELQEVRHNAAVKAWETRKRNGWKSRSKK